MAVRVISIKRLQGLLEDLSKYGEPVIVCVENGETTIRKPWNPTAKEYADQSMSCDKAWIGVRVW